MNKLVIASVSGHSCIRQHKINIPMMDKGYEFHLIARKLPSYVEHYKTFSHYQHISQCLESINLYKDHVDLFHVHNEPSWYVCAIKEITDKPVILDVHDSYLTRTTPEESDKSESEGKPHVRVTCEERNAFQAADALVFVSETVRQEVMNEFALTQTSIVLPSYVPYTFYRYHTKEWLGGLVYQGRVTIPEEYEGMRNGTGAGYCDYLETAKETSRIGIDFHLYPARNDKPFTDLYGKMAVIHPGYQYTTLLDQISRHDWGLVGNLIDSPQWRKTLPNKLFDYIAAGVPCVCINADESSKLVERYGIGITVESLDELAKRWSEHRKCRENIWKFRKQLSMDENLADLIELYECAV